MFLFCWKAFRRSLWDMHLGEVHFPVESKLFTIVLLYCRSWVAFQLLKCIVQIPVISFSIFKASVFPPSLSVLYTELQFHIPCILIILSLSITDNEWKTVFSLNNGSSMCFLLHHIHGLTIEQGLYCHVLYYQTHFEI